MDGDACDCNVMQATAVQMDDDPWASPFKKSPPTTTRIGKTGIALGKIDVNLDSSTTIGSMLPVSLGGTPICTLICSK